MLPVHLFGVGLSLFEKQKHFFRKLFQGHQKFAPETIEFLLSKNQTKWLIELWTLKQEMETDDNHVTMMSFSLDQNTHFIIIHWRISCSFVGKYGLKLWKLCNLVCFLITYSGGNFWCSYKKRCFPQPVFLLRCQHSERSFKWWQCLSFELTCWKNYEYTIQWV